MSEIPLVFMSEVKIDPTLIKSNFLGVFFVCFVFVFLTRFSEGKIWLLK